MGLGPTAMEAHWRVSRGTRGSQSCDETKRSRHCLGVSSQEPAGRGLRNPRMETQVFKLLAGTLAPSTSLPFARGRGKVENVSESQSARLPGLLSPILKPQLHFKDFPLEDLKCWFQPFLGNPTAPDSL